MLNLYYIYDINKLNKIKTVTSSSNKCIDFASFHDLFLLDDVNFFNNVVFLSQFSILKKVNVLNIQYKQTQQNKQKHVKSVLNIQYKQTEENKK
jgi:hypothetical protein